MTEAEWKRALDAFEAKVRKHAGVSQELVTRARAVLDAAGHDENTGLVIVMAQQMLAETAQRNANRKGR
jgi:hypothetical protein